MIELVLVRGLPGSGKSTYAKRLIADGWDESIKDGLARRFIHLEADMYHTIGGVYRWDAAKVKTAHKWCLSMAESYLLAGEYSVVVSNTFTRRWELKPYVDAALKYGVIWSIVEMKNDYGNIHNVPPETIQGMRNRWEEWV